MFTANDGNLYIISSDQACKVHIPIGETSLVEVLSHDLVKRSPGLELLVATRDGTLICLGVGKELPQDYQIPGAAERFHQKNSCPAVTKTYNDFSFSIHKVRSLYCKRDYKMHIFRVKYYWIDPDV